jgi:hypothetical protein
MKVVVAALVATALGVRVVRSRHRRFLHPDGRSFTGELAVQGAGPPTGSGLIDRPAHHPVTVRISRGAGTRPGRADVLGLAVRVHGLGLDLLYSTAGRGRFTRHLPVPRHSFDTWYGSIMAYRTGTGRKVYLSARPDPDGHPLGRTLESVVAAADRDGARLLLMADDRAFGVVTFGELLPPRTDAALAFDPVHNSTGDLHPTGAIHGVRGLAYRLSQRWRGASPVEPDPEALVRAAGHR